MEDDIMAMVRAQGYIRTSQACALGAHEHTLGRLAAVGVLEHASRGVYLGVDQRTPEARHALLTRARLDDDIFAIASHHSALALRDIALFGVPWNDVHLMDARCSSRRRESLHRHVLREGDRVEDVDGYRAVAVPLAVAQVAARFGTIAGLVSLDHALHRGLCTVEEVAAVLASGRLRRGVTRARRALALADGRAESPGESRLRAIIAECPWRYDVQVEVGGPGGGYRVDLLVDDCVVLEFDGATKYEGVEGRVALVGEKAREDWIRQRGYGFMRVMWRELDHPATIRHTLQRQVVTARAARVGRSA